MTVTIYLTDRIWDFRNGLGLRQHAVGCYQRFVGIFCLHLQGGQKTLMTTVCRNHAIHHIVLFRGIKSSLHIPKILNTETFVSEGFCRRCVIKLMQSQLPKCRVFKLTDEMNKNVRQLKRDTCFWIRKIYSNIPFDTIVLIHVLHGSDVGWTQWVYSLSRTSKELG
jgi:hypothetical protein